LEDTAAQLIEVPAGRDLDAAGVGGVAFLALYRTRLWRSIINSISSSLNSSR
jgi:hypothetical protein